MGGLHGWRDEENPQFIRGIELSNPSPNYKQFWNRQTDEQMHDSTCWAVIHSKKKFILYFILLYKWTNMYVLFAICTMYCHFLLCTRPSENSKATLRFGSLPPARLCNKLCAASWPDLSVVKMKTRLDGDKLWKPDLGINCAKKIYVSRLDSGLPIRSKTSFVFN